MRHSLEVLGAVGLECEAIAAHLAALPEDGFLGPTNCPPWTLKELVVHTWQTLQLPATLRPGVGSPASAADWYRRSERETAEYRQRNVARARSAAEVFSTGAAAVEALLDTGRRFENRLASETLDRLIATPNIASISVADYAITRVVSVAVHGIDVAISLGVEPFTTTPALEITCSVLEQLLDADLAALGWTPHDLVSWGTGRSQPSASAAPQEILGRLPVIS